MDDAPRVRVIGGGMTGLTVALRLAQNGLPVVVHERDTSLGGLSDETSIGSVPIARFYHCVLPTDTALLSLFKEIGLPDVVQWNHTRTGFFHDRHLIEMTTTSDFLCFPALKPIDRLRLGWTIGYCGLRKRWERFDREPISTFLRRHGGERLFSTIWKPLLLSKLGTDYDRFSASFIWATIHRMLSARKAKNRSEKLGFVRGGYGKVFAALRNAIVAAGGEVQTGSSITQVSRLNDGRSRWSVRCSDRDLSSLGVVMCVAAPIAAGWIEKSVPDGASALRKVDYLGVVCDVLLLKRSLTPYYVLNLTDRQLPFTGIIETSNLTGPDEYGGHSLVYLPRYCGQSSPVWDMDEAAIHSENVLGLQRIVPDFTEGDIIGWQIHRARYVQPIHGVGTGNRVPHVVLADGLAFVSTAQIHPWPVFNDVVVRHVDSHMAELLGTLQANSTS